LIIDIKEVAMSEVTSPSLSPSLSPSAALPIARVFLRVLIVFNWLFAAALLALLVVSPNEQWIMSAFKIPPSPAAAGLVMGLRIIAVIGLATIPLGLAILKRLLAIVDTVRAGDPFVATNAQRLQTIAWLLLALQIVGIIIGMFGGRIATPKSLHFEASFSLDGWLAVLLTFLLARVFAEGAAMREDLKGTV
jgi:hypothetical protein